MGIRPTLGAPHSPTYICSVLQFYGFGEYQADGHTSSDGYSNHGVVFPDVKTFAKLLNQAIINWDENANEYTEFKRLATVHAWVTSKQPKALAAFREFGFLEIGPTSMKKYEHTMSLFVLDTGAILKRIKEITNAST